MSSQRPAPASAGSIANGCGSLAWSSAVVKATTGWLKRTLIRWVVVNTSVVLAGGSTCATSRSPITLKLHWSGRLFRRAPVLEVIPGARLAS